MNYDKQAILRALDLRAFYSQAVPSLKINGTAEAVGLCPFHDDRAHPNFHINLDTGLWKCWACNAAGDVFHFVERRDSIPFPQACDTLAHFAGMNGEPNRATPKILRRHPWTDEAGRVAYHLRLDGDPKFIWAQDQDGKRLGRGVCTPTLRHLKNIRAASYMITTEGEHDSDTLNSWLKELGRFPEAVATTTPNGATDVKADYLLPLAGKPCVVLTGDNDEAGRGYVTRCREKLPASVLDVRRLMPPTGHKDWAEWKDAGMTAQTFAQLLDQAEPYPIAEAEPETAPAPAQVVASEPWPILDEAAYHGLPGDVVRLLSSHTEADPVALLASFLAEAGTMLNRGPHLILDGSYHPLLFWAVIVGQSSKSRKGSAGNRIKKICELADEAWTRGLQKGTLSSGEGLVYAVCDATSTNPGVEDKRLFLVQSEFAMVLRVMARDGSTLSGVLRDAWDGLDLAPMTKKDPVRATSPHVGLVGHVTKDELTRNLTSTEASNGFGNRFVWLLVKRSQELPFSSVPNEEELHALAGRIGKALTLARTIGNVGWTDQAKAAWKAGYHDLSADRPGLAGALLGRAEAQVMRLAALYAVLDGKGLINLDHLKAALALWAYAEASTRLIFGDSIGDDVADTILRALQDRGELDETAISGLFSGHVKGARLDQAKGLLQRNRLAFSKAIQTAGRTKIMWRLWEKKENEAKKEGEQ